MYLQLDEPNTRAADRQGEDGENCLSISQMLSVSHTVLCIQPPMSKLAGEPRHNNAFVFPLNNCLSQRVQM